MLREDGFFFLPNLLSFENGNTYLGSFRGLRFRIEPTEEELEGGAKRRILKCICWHGEFCLEESEVVADTVCTLDEQGREAVIDWLEEQWIAMPKN